MPGNSYDPVAVSRKLRINADIIMDEISCFVDKELDRFSCGIEYMKKEMTRHVDKQQDRYGKLSTEWIKERDDEKEKDSR